MKFHCQGSGPQLSMWQEDYCPWFKCEATVQTVQECHYSGIWCIVDDADGHREHVETDVVCFLQSRPVNQHASKHWLCINECVCSLWALLKKSPRSSAAEEISHSSNAAIFWATLNTHPQRGPDLLSLSTLEIRSAREQENQKYGQIKRECMPLAARVVARMPLFFFVLFLFLYFFDLVWFWCFVNFYAVSHYMTD